MPSTTETIGIPYPASTDKVSDYPAVAGSAAATIEAALLQLIVKGTPVLKWGTATGRPVIVAGTSVMTLTGAGPAAIVHNASLTGVMAVLLTSGDSGAYSGPLSLRNSAGDIDGNKFIVYFTNAVNGPRRVDWLVIGWTETPVGA